MFSFFFGLHQPVAHDKSDKGDGDQRLEAGSKSEDTGLGVNESVCSKRKHVHDHVPDKRARLSSPANSDILTTPVLQAEVDTPLHDRSDLHRSSEIAPEILARIEDWMKSETGSADIKVEREDSVPPLDHAAEEKEREVKPKVEQYKIDDADPHPEATLGVSIGSQTALFSDLAREREIMRGDMFYSFARENSEMKERIAELEKSEKTLARRLGISSRTVNELHGKMGTLVTKLDKALTSDNNHVGVIEDLKVELAAAVDREKAADERKEEALHGLRSQLYKAITEGEKRKIELDKEKAAVAKLEERITESQSAEAKSKTSLAESQAKVIALTKKVDHQRSHLRQFQEGNKSKPTAKTSKDDTGALRKEQLAELERLRGQVIALNTAKGQWQAEKTAIAARVFKAERQRDDLMTRSHEWERHRTALQARISEMQASRVPSLTPSSSRSSSAGSLERGVWSSPIDGGRGRDTMDAWQSYWATRGR